MFRLFMGGQELVSSNSEVHDFAEATELYAQLAKELVNFPPRES